MTEMDRYTPNPNELMNRKRVEIANDLVEMVGEVTETCYTGIGTAGDLLETIAAATKLAVEGTLMVIDSHAQIFPSENGLGEMPFFQEGELQAEFNDRYAAAINT